MSKIRDYAIERDDEGKPTRMFWLGDRPMPDPKAALRAKREAALVGRLRRLYGNGPEGAKCDDCRHLMRVEYARVYLKCRFGPQSHGPATDWRAGWLACGKFEPNAT